MPLRVRDPCVLIDMVDQLRVAGSGGLLQAGSTATNQIVTSTPKAKLNASATGESPFAWRESPIPALDIEQPVIVIATALLLPKFVISGWVILKWMFRATRAYPSSGDGFLLKRFFAMWVGGSPIL